MSVDGANVNIYETRCTLQTVKRLPNANPSDKNQVNAEADLSCGGDRNDGKDDVDAPIGLRQSPPKANPEDTPCSALKTTSTSPRAVREREWANCCAGSGCRCCWRRDCRKRPA